MFVENRNDHGQDQVIGNPINADLPADCFSQGCDQPLPPLMVAGEGNVGRARRGWLVLGGGQRLGGQQWVRHRLKNLRSHLEIGLNTGAFVPPERGRVEERE